MPRVFASTLALALGALCAVLVASCGSSGSSQLLSAASADSLNRVLDRISQDVSSGNCVGAANLAGSAADQINKQSGIDAGLKNALASGFQQLQSLAADPVKCGAAQTNTRTTTTPTNTQTTPTNTQTTPTQKPPTQTQTTPTNTGTNPTGGTGGGGPGL